MRHLKCIALLRPSSESVAAMEAELRTPKYSSYSLFFTNVLKKSDIERLAEADEHDVVKEVQVRFVLRDNDQCPDLSSCAGIFCRLCTNKSSSVLAQLLSTTIEFVVTISS
jgi:hypothetical protein